MKIQTRVMFHRLWKHFVMAGLLFILPTRFMELDAIFIIIGQLKGLPRIKGVKLEKANFAIICHDFSHLSDYARQVDNSTFKLMKRLLPGPYTFILNASSKVPHFFTNKKKTIGIQYTRK